MSSFAKPIIDNIGLPHSIPELKIIWFPFACSILANIITINSLYSLFLFLFLFIIAFRIAMILVWDQWAVVLLVLVLGFVGCGCVVCEEVYPASDYLFAVEGQHHWCYLLHLSPKQWVLSQNTTFLITTASNTTKHSLPRWRIIPQRLRSYLLAHTNIYIGYNILTLWYTCCTIT